MHVQYATVIMQCFAWSTNRGTSSNREKEIGMINRGMNISSTQSDWTELENLGRIILILIVINRVKHQ